MIGRAEISWDVLSPGLVWGREITLVTVFNSFGVAWVRPSVSKLNKTFFFKKKKTKLLVQLGIIEILFNKGDSVL